jgi:hypothetical protein
MIQRIVYFSRNVMAGTDSQMKAEVEGILATARRNNAQAGVTGSLIFNSGGFAQVLEGRPEDVGAIFEKIQRDERHSDVLVLECRDVATRTFPNWSMGFVGARAGHERLFGAISESSGFDPSRFGAADVFAAMDRLVREEEGALASSA